jgi:hypothetical protein
MSRYAKRQKKMDDLMSRIRGKMDAVAFEAREGWKLNSFHARTLMADMAEFMQHADWMGDEVRSGKDGDE